MFEEQYENLKKRITDLAGTYKQMRTEKVAQIQNNNQPAASISGSVGQGGKNDPTDVKTVQILLNKIGAKLGEDGQIGPKTIQAIQVFQQKVFAGSAGDGKIDPGGKTWNALLVAAKKGGASTNENANPNTNNNNNTKPTETPQEDTGSYAYFNHPKWQEYNFTMQAGSRTAKPMNATAQRLLRSILAGANIKNAIVTSTWRSFTDQAYCVLTQVTEAEALSWYGYVARNKDVYYAHRRRLASGEDKEKVFQDYGAWLEKNVGMNASNHLSGIAIDVAGCDLNAFNRFANTLLPVKGSGVSKVFPEPGRTHIEFTFQVASGGNVSSGGNANATQNTQGQGQQNQQNPAQTTATNDGKSISAPVGRNAGATGNQAADVKLVQTLLKKLGFKVTESGTLDEATQAAIDLYQVRIFGRQGDGKIDPGGTTWKNLFSGNPGTVPSGQWTPGANGNLLTSSGNILVSIPKDASGALHAIVMFGGALGYGRNFMMQQTQAAAPEFFGQYILVFCEMRTGFQLATYNNILSSKGCSIKTYSACGFSGGGPDARGASGAKTIGLMDPETSAGASAPGNAYMVYHPNNWSGSLAIIGQYIDQMAKGMGARAINTKAQGKAGSFNHHLEMPALFLKNFKSKL